MFSSSKVGSGNHGQLVSTNWSQGHAAKQRRLTATLALQCVCTLVLYMLPLQLYKVYADVWPFALRRYLLVVRNANATVNLAIYTARMPEFRIALSKWLRCKPLPDNINLWPTHSQTVPRPPARPHV